MKKKSSSNSKPYFLVGDFETNAHQKEPNMYFGSYRYLYNPNLRRYFLTIEQFFTSLYELDKKKIIIYFHNLEFDFSYCWKYVAENYIPLSWDEKVPDSNNYMKILQDEFSRLYCVTLFRDKQTIKFVDSFKLLGQSVEVLGTKIGYPKQEWDYEQTYHYNTIWDVPKKLFHYIDADIDIVATYLLKMPKFHLTIGGSVYSEFKQYYKQKRPKYEPYFETIMETITEELWMIGRESYFGGFCNMNFQAKNQVITKIFMYDVNSMYPTRCTECLPYGVPSPTQQEANDVKLYHIYIYQAKLKADAPCGIIPKKRYQVKDNFRTEHYYRQVENKYFWVWEHELEHWKTFYELSYKIEKTLYQKTRPWVASFIHENYKLRKEAKENNNYVDDKKYKDKLNNLTGKPSENPYKINKYLTKCTCEKNTRSYKRHLLYSNKYCFTNYPSTGKKVYRNIFFTSFITSKARSILFGLIWKHRDKWVYSDTDSFYASEPIDTIPLSNELGDWDITLGTNFKVLRPKCYIYTNTNNQIIPKISGLSPKGKKYITYDNFYPQSIIKDANLKKERTLTGMRLIPRPFKI